MNIVIVNAWQLFLKGGPMMWPILVLSVVVMGIGLNRIVYLLRMEKRLVQEKISILESLRQGHLKETMRLSENLSGPIARMAKAGIVRFGSSVDLMKGVMAEEISYQSRQFINLMGALKIIANTVPLLGLLGTVNAMTIVFHAVHVRSNALNPMAAGDLAVGIWQALLSTSAGLVVGIISYVIYQFCAILVDRLIIYMEHANIEIANILQQLSETAKAAHEE